MRSTLLILFFAGGMLMSGTLMAQSQDNSSLTKLTADSLLSTARLNIYQHPDTALYFSELALKKAREENRPDLEVQALIYLGVMGEIKADFKKGINHLKLAKDLAKEHNLREKEAVAFLNLGNIHYRLDNYDFALQYFMDANQIFTALGNDRLRAAVLNNQSMIMEMYQDYEMALDYLDSAKTIYRGQGPEMLIKRADQNRSRLLIELGELEQAMALLHSLHKYYSEEESGYDLATNFYNFGKTYQALGDTAKALENYQHSLDHYLELGMKYGAGHAHEAISFIYEGKGELDLSLHHMKSAIDLYRESEDMARLQDGHNLLGDLQLKSGDTTSALNSYIKANELDDTLKIASQDQMKDRLAISFDSERFRNQLTQSEIEKRQNRNWLIITSILLVILLILAVRLYLNLGQKQKMLKQLRLLNEHIASQNEELEDLNVVKARMFSIIAHDLRSPLALLQGSLQVINAGKMSDSEKEEMLVALGEAVTHTRFTLDNLFHWAKGQMEGASSKKMLFDLSSVVEDTLPLYEWMMNQKGVSLENMCEHSLPVYVDRDQVRFIIRNILHNAYKFTPSGGTVSLSCVKTPDGKTQIHIKDTGSGISRKNIEALISGKQLSTSRGTNREAGSGLGLTMVKQFIDMNNGKLEIESKENQGSTFKLWFPSPEES